jgi:hypothetical protein
MDVCALPILSCSLCCANTISTAICAPPKKVKRSEYTKIRENHLLALRIHLASPIGEESAPRFAYKRRERPSAINPLVYLRYLSTAQL